jgi:deazaflavin-dependent oxidoreductase (nitroreductase family)
VVAGSLGGYDKHPQWYLNLVANPAVAVHVKDERFAATARTATPVERPRLWDILLGALPELAEYQAKTEREIPVVVLERAEPRTR